MAEKGKVMVIAMKLSLLSFFLFGCPTIIMALVKKLIFLREISIIINNADLKFVVWDFLVDLILTG